MTARISEAQARALNLAGAPKAKQRTTRRVVRGAPYHTICHSCGMECRTQAAEDRHVAHGHNRFDLVITTTQGEQ